MTFIVFLILLTQTVTVEAQVVINEFSSATTDDWIEIYELSTATESANLNEYLIQDSTGPIKNLSGVMNPGSFAVFDISNRLNNGGDVIKLARTLDGAVVDQINYGDQGGICTPALTGSIGRLPDGTGAFTRFISATRGVANAGFQDSCPTATPLFTPPLPTETPRPTTTSTPTSTPNITPTLKPITASATPKKSDKPLSTDNSQEELVLGLRNELQSSSPVPTNNPETEKTFPILPLVFISGGLICIILAGWGLFTKLRSDGYSQ